MFSEIPAPANFLGGSRFTKEIPFTLDQLEQVDVVLISHDHYDHLDYPSIQALSQKTKQFLVPLGIGAHLERWGVAKEKIQELDWWEEHRFEEIQFAFTPAQHFSGRALNDRFHTLWGSWVIVGPKDRIFFSGDSGYAPHFKQIGEQYGPFDISFMEAGQYNKLWPDVHMFPDQTYQAAKDINAKAVMPIHWAAFSLSTHPWQEPAERLQSNAESDTLKVIIPQIGEIVRLDYIADRVNDPWWTQIQEPK
jgi:L-ascorbate metabolism protein UlaG (beta-lactamase superfamily)